MRVDAKLIAYHAPEKSSDPYFGTVELEIGNATIVAENFFAAERDSIGSGLKLELRPDFTGINESWEQILSSNQNSQEALSRCPDGTYMALGRVVSIQPVIASCGCLMVRVPTWSNDPKVIGEYVGFKVASFAAYG